MNGQEDHGGGRGAAGDGALVDGRFGGRGAGRGRGRGGGRGEVPPPPPFAGQAEPQQQYQKKKKQSAFSVGDSCFTNIDGAICSGTIIQIPTSQSEGGLYKIQLNNEDQDNTTDDHQDVSVIVAEVGNIYHPDDKVPSLKKQDKRTQDVSPWRTSRAKKYCMERLLDDDDSIHNKCDEEVYNTSFYDDGEPVIKTKYLLSDFKKNYKKLKEKSTGQAAAAAEDEAALKGDSKLYPRPERDFHGNPYYAQSTIRAKLIADVKSGAAGRDKKPMDILASRHEYQPLQHAPTTFRNYLYREIRKESESTGWQIRRNKMGYKQHEQDHSEARNPPK